MPKERSDSFSPVREQRLFVGLPWYCDSNPDVRTLTGDKQIVVWRLKWQKPEPSSIVETVTVVSCVRHVCREVAHWDCRLVVATDNLCARLVELEWIFRYF